MFKMDTQNISIVKLKILTEVLIFYQVFKHFFDSCKIELFLFSNVIILEYFHCYKYFFIYYINKTYVYKILFEKIIKLIIQSFFFFNFLYVQRLF